LILKDLLSYASCAFSIKVMSVVFVIKFTHLTDFKKFWLECNSSLLYQIFDSGS